MTDLSENRTFSDPSPKDDPVSAAWLTMLNGLMFEIFNGAETKAEARTALDVYSKSQSAAASHTHTLSAISDSGDLAALDTVDTSEIEANAVTEAKLNDGAVATAKLAASAVTEAKLNDGAVATAKLADEAVSLAKMAHMATDSLLGRDTAGSGDVEVLSVATVLTMLSVYTQAQSDANFHPKGGVVAVEEETGTTYNTAAADAGKWKEMNNASAITVTVDKNELAEGDVIYFCQKGAGQVTISAGTGVTINKGASFNAKTLEQYATATLVCVDDTADANVFRLAGQLELA